MVALCAAIGEQITPAIAEAPTVHHALATKAAQLDLKRSIASMTSLDPKQIEIKATYTVVLVRFVNTLYNSGPASDREYLASTIAALIKKDSIDNPSLASVVALHVAFIKRSAWRAKTLDAMEFRRDQAGTLRRHGT
jgi:hypothetical protein